MTLLSLDLYLFAYEQITVKLFHLSVWRLEERKCWRGRGSEAASRVEGVHASPFSCD